MTMAKLTEKKIISLLREQYEKKLHVVENSLNAFLNELDAVQKKGVIGIDTKVRHKGSRLLYTIEEIGPNEIILLTPTGNTFTVSDKEFTEEYELD